MYNIVTSFINLRAVPGGAVKKMICNGEGHT